MLRAIQEARLTGQVTRVQTAPGVYTEFDPNKTDLTRILRELEMSIADSDDYDENDPVQLACYNNRTRKVMAVSTSYPGEIYGSVT